MINNKLAAALASMYCISGWAQIEPPGVPAGPTVKVSGGISYGLGERLSDPAPELLFANNARQAGLSATNIAGRNQDDGNMNYRKGDLFTNVATAFVDIDLKKGSVSGLLRALAWYDQELKSGGVPWRRPKECRHKCEAKFVTRTLAATCMRAKPSNDADLRGFAKQVRHFAARGADAKQSRHRKLRGWVPWAG